MKNLKEMYKEMTKKVFNKEINGIATSLGLNVTPTLSFDVSNENAEGTVMYVEHTTYVRNTGWFTKVVDHTETDSVVHVNIEALKKQCLMYKLTCGSKEVDYDVILILLCHECRHIWQAESQWSKGKSYDAFGLNDMHESIFGHGSLEEEKDANNWAMNYVTGKRRVLADYLIESQNSTGIYVDVATLREKALKATNAYNPMWAKLVDKL